LIRLSGQIPEPIEIDDDQCAFIPNERVKELQIETHENKNNINNVELEENKHEIEEIFDDYEISDIDARNELQDLMSKSTGD
jgi:hypothetical protein